ncbi:hypothetical protein J31TS4_44340 [Paenibacillus sp. J31TS4]|uniref:TetR/AcrR family transcriptional regulator n=1 Tax=Paenibacillus sp. J31TS4 TaxID=2807195 RepID=UPI001B1565D6|nr:TetR/AcrR family transcriptional regulator [Paenibacillus sp. J31TS4]GIP41154.1 hypothetical protein J31TS4_44340 [Paenibacillus sp. J31TS4]
MSTSEPAVKERILSSAKKLFARHGYDGTTVRRICEEAGVNLALVSYHFGGKEQLFQSLFTGFPPKDKLAELETRMDDPVEGLRFFVREFVLFRSADPDMLTILHQEIQQATPRVPYIRERMAPFWSRLHHLLALGRERGVFRIESVDTTFLFLLGVVLSYQLTDYFAPIFGEEPLSPGEMAAATNQFVFRALGIPEPAEETSE